MSAQTKSKKTQKIYNNQNPLEVLKSIGAGVVDSAVNDVAKDSFANLWEQMFNAGKSHEELETTGDLSEGQEISLKNQSKTEKREHAAPAINYHQEIVETDKRRSHENQKVLNSKIQEILIELKKISETSSEIAMEFKEITVEQRIEKPGEYHVTFFQWMLNVIKTARARIEDSGAWLKTMQNKKKQKGYWQMFKKHGTSFGLSNERVVATQVG